jgi:hypothetical protein
MTRPNGSLGRARGGPCAALVLCLVGALQVEAIDVKERAAELPPKLAQALASIDFERYEVRPQPVAAAPAALAGMGSFAGDRAGDWNVQMDARTATPLKIEGPGVPLVPGSGNSMGSASLGAGAPAAGEAFSLADVAPATDAFLAQNGALLRVAADSVVLDERRSVGVGRNNRSWLVRYQSVLRGADGEPIPVRGAYVFLRISHGNLVQLGNQLAVEPQGIDTTGIISDEQAIAAALDLFDSSPDASALAAAVDIGQTDKSLQVVPVNLAAGALGHELVRSVLVTTPELSIELWLDAHSGELVYAIDRLVTVAATVSGGVYPFDNSGSELVRGLPFLGVVNGSPKTTDRAGVYDYAPPGSLATASLEGDFVSVSDRCGASSLSASAADGDLEFGAGGGTDCGTPGVGGAGNTAAARATYYHLNMIKEKARGFLNLPLVSTAWLEADLTSNVNINDSCNAFWNGVTVNFYRSGTPPGGSFCANTGENATVALHEFGHGLDERTNGFSPDYGSGEAFGDTVAFLESHESCIGRNFRPGRPCSFGCDATCDGVRDVAVTPAVRPSNIEQAPADCRRPGLACPYFTNSGFPYQGPMRYEGHCESLIASGAVWDMIEGFRARYGDGAGWALGDRIWYESLYQTGAAYQVVAGGACDPAATVDGCGVDNWYTVFLSLDDDNGDLADGTPNADLIWNAFDAHGIACGAPPPVSSTCPALAAPVLTVTRGSGVNDLSWSAVAGAAAYRIFRNDLGCGRGFSQLGEVAAPATSLADTTVDTDMRYFYAVQAVAANDICVSRFSACVDSGGAVALVLTPAALTVEVGESGSLTAMVTDGGAGLPGVSISFQSSDPGVATVGPAAVTDATGAARATVQGVAQGSARVEASSMGVSDDSTVTVEPRDSPLGAPPWLATLLLVALVCLWRRARRAAARAAGAARP